MKNIGILTFHRQLNYGGVLQALALRDTTAELSGDDVEIINLWMDPRDAMLLGKIHNPNIPLYARIRNAFKARKRPYGREAFEVRRAKTIHLIHDRLHLSAETYRTPEDLRRLKPYDTVLVGSDQVWNYDLVRAFRTNPWLTAEFPEFQDRVAYAASYGVTEIPERLCPVYRAGLRHFRTVTIRESSGSDLHERLTGTRPTLVLDPTLLRTETQWTQEITKHTPPHPLDYLLCYWLDGLTPERLAWMRRVSRHYGFPITLLVSGPMNWTPKTEDWLTVRFDADPLDFVSFIAHAKGIITDSFHGLQFAAIFRRRIACFIASEINGTSTSARFRDFCQRYNVSEVCKDIQHIHDTPDVQFADLTNIDTDRLKQDRQDSLAQLRAMLP